MELDSGASITVMSEIHFKKLFPKVKVVKSSVILHNISGVIRNAGEASVTVRFNNHTFLLPVV